MADFGFLPLAELPLCVCVLVFVRMRGYPVIWLLLTGVYHAALSMRELAHHGSEWSLMYHRSSLVSTSALPLAKVYCLQTNRLSAGERGSESCATNKSHGFTLTHTRAHHEQRVSQWGLGFTVISPYVDLSSRGHIH